MSTIPSPAMGRAALALAAAILIPSMLVGEGMESAFRGKPVAAQRPSGRSLPSGLIDGYSAYVPKPNRAERRVSWEPKIVPEIAPGIYEFDYRHMDFGGRIALTIDDSAPNMDMTRQLDILASRGIKAVFFIVGLYFLDAGGKPKPESRALLRRVVDEGHEIGSHSYNHVRLDQGAYADDYARIARNLEMNQEAVDLCLGYHYPIRYVRPPNGAHWTPEYQVDRYLLDHGLFLVNWNATPGDWCMNYPEGHPQRMSVGEIIAVGLREARLSRGGVMLYHGFPRSAGALDAVLLALLEPPDGGAAFRFVPLRELLYEKYLSGPYR